MTTAERHKQIEDEVLRLKELRERAVINIQQIDASIQQGLGKLALLTELEAEAKQAEAKPEEPNGN